jgi:hypothetical protein
MPEAPALVAEFRGAVRALRAPGEPLGLTLSGRSLSPPGEELTVGFAGVAPADLPEVLEDARVERGGPAEYLIASSARSFTISARSVHVHRDVGEEFYRALPPRPAPLVRRLLLGAALRIARSRAGLSLLRALRR